MMANANFNILLLIPFTMKKVFRTIGIIIILAWAWFFYVFANPQTVIAQKVLTAIGMIPSENNQDTDTWSDATWAKIDLTNCVSYFDGCNHCSVKDGKPDACTLMYCDKPTEPRCDQYATGNVTGTEDTGNAGMANPASVNCEKNGWTLNIVTSSDGGQVGMCTLSNGTVCEEWAYMRGECWENSGAATYAPGNPGSSASQQPRPRPSKQPKVEPYVSDTKDTKSTAPKNKDTTVCTTEYKPVCALIQVECIKAPCNPVEQTFSNRCFMDGNAQAKFLHDGGCIK